MSPTGVIERIKKARLRGCGGAGFPTAIKWEYTRASQADRRFILCNADEGEPGTFKDRILLTEYADLLWDGMTIAGYAIGASEGILYLRGEYAYLEPWLQHTLEQRRQAGWLGPQVGGRSDFAFDIRIQMGAGAYICGEETALISSCEGLRGDPKNRPPFPAQRGYLGYPSSVNNVETLCAAARIMEKGAEWFASHGTMRSAGSKLLSISGDCKRSGVYEVVFGTPLREVLRMAGAEDVQAVQVGGPSGQLIPSNEFDRVICYDDLSTGGSIMVFGQQRDLLEVVHQFLEFFAEESCGYCTPCRVGNVLLAKGVSRVIAGQAQASDLDALQELAETVKSTSRCGLGQTSPNAVLTTLKKFRYLYEKCLCSATSGLRPDFDITAATTQAAAIAGRSPVLALHHENGS
jgi:[NiFe] hydrogenase diaphorase moiety large subunit